MPVGALLEMRQDLLSVGFHDLLLLPDLVDDADTI